MEEVLRALWNRRSGMLIYDLFRSRAAIFLDVFEVDCCSSVYADARREAHLNFLSLLYGMAVGRFFPMVEIF